METMLREFLGSLLPSAESMGDKDMVWQPNLSNGSRCTQHPTDKAASQKVSSGASRGLSQ
jgi:hypothetical protein